MKIKERKIIFYKWIKNFLRKLKKYCFPISYCDIILKILVLFFIPLIVTNLLLPVTKIHSFPILLEDYSHSCSFNEEKITCDGIKLSFVENIIKKEVDIILKTYQERNFILKDIPIIKYNFIVINKSNEYFEINIEKDSKNIQCSEKKNTNEILFKKGLSYNELISEVNSLPNGILLCGFNFIGDKDNNSLYIKEIKARSEVPKIIKIIIEFNKITLITTYLFCMFLWFNFIILFHKLFNSILPKYKIFNRKL